MVLFHNIIEVLDLTYDHRYFHVGMALVHLKNGDDNSPTPNGYAAWRLQRTELGRAAASIRFNTAAPMAASVC